MSDKKIKVTSYGEKSNNNKQGAKIDIYSRDPKKGPHDTIHIKVNTDNKSYEAVTKVGGKKETSSGDCFLTSACMMHFQDKFDDNCMELTILRFFRDNYVSKEDIEYYYKIAPKIVKVIDDKENNDLIYNWIYDNVVSACVTAILNGDYKFAYDRYRNSVLILEEEFLNNEVKYEKAITRLKYVKE